MRRKNVIYIVMALLMIIAGILCWYIYTSPVYSLYKTKKAIEKRDYSTFVEYINVDSLINNYTDKISLSRLDSNDALESFEKKLLSSIPFGLRPQVTRIIKKLLKKSVENGNLAHISIDKGNSISQDNPDETWKLLNDIRVGGLEYIDIHDNTSVIGINCKSISNGKKFVFRVRMRKIENHWQIVELMDFQNLKKLMI